MQQLPAGLTWAAVAAGASHTCGLDSAGGLHCWGYSESGQAAVPQLPGSLTWVAVAGGGAHTCGLDSAGGLHCWGRNGHGQTNVPELPAGRTWGSPPHPSSAARPPPPAPLPRPAAPAVARRQVIPLSELAPISTCLGDGYFGQVYLGKLRGTEVAIKFLRCGARRRRGRSTSRSPRCPTI